MNLYKLHSDPTKLYNYSKLPHAGIYMGDVIGWEQWMKLSAQGYKHIIGGFDCSYNELTSLEGSPKTITGYFDCRKNKLPSLKGSPVTVGGTFYCYGNKLTTLVGGPETVGGDYRAQGNNFHSKPDTSFISIGGKFVWR